MSSFLASHPQESLLQSHRTVIIPQFTDSLLECFLLGRLRKMSFLGLPFCLQFKMTDQNFIYCMNPGYAASPLPSKCGNNLDKKWFSLGSVFNGKAPRKPSHTHLGNHR